MPLTDKAVKAAKPEAKEYKLADSGGLYLLVYPTGKKAWKLKYRTKGKEQKLHIGYYPEMPLADARETRDDAKKLLRRGGTPDAVHTPRQRMEGVTWYEYAVSWHKKNEAQWSKRHAERQLCAIKEMRPFIGGMLPKDVDALDILAGLRKIEQRGAHETAKKTKQCVGQVFKAAMLERLAKHNPVPDLRGALTLSPETQNNPHLDATELPGFLRALNAYKGHPVTRIATWVLLHCFMRTKEMRYARWDEIDWDGAVWRIPPERMKMTKDRKRRRLKPMPHLVPLSRQVVALLRDLHAITGHGALMFPQALKRDKPLSENAVLTVIASIGYKGIITGHGFRGTASTILNEQGFDERWIELQLAHLPRDMVAAAYNHAKYLPQRRGMMQWWADYLEERRRGNSGNAME